MTHLDDDLFTRLADAAPPTPNLLERSVRRGTTLRRRRTALRAGGGVGIAALSTAAILALPGLLPTGDNRPDAPSASQPAADPTTREFREIVTGLLAPYGTISDWQLTENDTGNPIAKFTLTDETGPALVTMLLGGKGDTAPPDLSCRPDIEGCVPLPGGGYSAMLTADTRPAHTDGDIDGYANFADGTQVAASFYNSHTEEGAKTRDRPALSPDQVRAFLTDPAWADAPFPTGPVPTTPDCAPTTCEMIKP